MDYRFLIIFIFISATNVKCQKSISIEDTKITDNNNTAKEIENVKVEEKIPTIKLPNLCTICKCTDDIIDCDKRNLTYHFEDTQWPNKTMKVVSFEENLLVHVKPFPALEIRRLILRKNKITKIDNSAFKKIINLTELDLSYNQLTTENLQPQVFEGKFSPDIYEPLEKLVILNLAYNMLHSLHHDLFEHTTNLKVLDLSGNLFSILDSRSIIAISSLPNLEELNLSYCGLKTIPETSFYTCKNLKKLNLSGNQLTAIPNALKEATSLEILYMDENPIQIIDKGHSFPNMIKLKELSLCCMPHLTIVGSGSFSGLTSLEHLRIQNCPNLESIHENALASWDNNSTETVWPPLKKLDLSDNALRYLPQLLISRWDWLEKLDLTNNKWSCDCDNEYLINVLLPTYGKRLMGEEMNTLACAAPPEHEGENLTSLFNRSLRCLDLYNARPEKDAMILVGILIGILFAIPVCLTTFIFWRRGFFFCGSSGPASFSRAFYKRTMNDDEF
ncbi:leucine-rich repeat neuronal protein 3 [Apis cerana]|uniref:leucine-rich repeat neuronal protein 3 n=1 Tax=Apis cerana TaxID=7461 RepID=UPI0007E2B1C9|nr:leucine-rich repeat neuronal protein 3 [Apis cerana]